MEITLNRLRKYHTPKIPEAGTNIKYDSRELKNNPNKLNLWYKQRMEQKTTPEDNTTNTQNTVQTKWGKYNTT